MELLNHKPTMDQHASLALTERFDYKNDNETKQPNKTRKREANMSLHVVTLRF